jgi:rhodanese-related sulfurtransferase/DNA-binding HxlR family transcriptional regulator
VSSRQAKDALFEAIATVGKAFASSRRLELLDLLAQGPRTVDELARASEQSVANTSQHLQSLHAGGLVKRERQGLSVRYELADDDVLALWLSLRDVAAERLAEVERAASEYLGAPVAAIARSELERRLDERSVVLIDVRPAEEFEAGHIEGALSIPIDELDARMDELPDGVELVAYCRGPFCAFASEAVRRLHATGRTARRLELGWAEWRLGQSTRRPAGGGAS